MPALATPLPAGKQVVVRPVLDNMPNVHCWSVGGSDGAHSVRLDTLDEGQTRLLACAPTSMPQPGRHFLPSLPQLSADDCRCTLTYITFQPSLIRDVASSHL